MSDAVPFASTPAPRPMRPVRPVRTWDVVLTIVLLVGLVLFAMLMTFFAGFLAMASDACGAAGTCDDGAISLGILLGIAGPWVILVLAIVAATVLPVVRRIASWVPIVAAGLIVGNLVVAAGIATAGAGR